MRSRLNYCLAPENKNPRGRATFTASRASRGRGVYGGPTEPVSRSAALGKRTREQTLPHYPHLGFRPRELGQDGAGDRAAPHPRPVRSSGLGSGPVKGGMPRRGRAISTRVLPKTHKHHSLVSRGTTAVKTVEDIPRRKDAVDDQFCNYTSRLRKQKDDFPVGT